MAFRSRVFQSLIAAPIALGITGLAAVNAADGNFKRTQSAHTFSTSTRDFRSALTSHSNFTEVNCHRFDGPYGPIFVGDCGPDFGDITEYVPPQAKLVIVSLGDSYASGEGNPDVPLDPTNPSASSVEWKSNENYNPEACHRSEKNGHYLAFEKIEEEYGEEIDVEFVSFACSGSPLNPTRGFRLTGDVRHASRFLGSDPLVQFTSGTVEMAAYHRVARRSVFSWRVRLAAVHSPRADRYLTPDDRLYGGGSNTVRGFSHNELGPIVRVIDETFPDSIAATVFDSLSRDGVAAYRIRRSATGGDRLAFANAEYRFPLPVFSGRVFGAAFVDAGLVYLNETGGGAILDVLDNHFRVTPGVGFRVTSPLGPMRLDIGYNPYPPQASPEWYGEAFEETTTGGRIYDLRPLPLLQNVAPETGLLGRFRLHFSVGQAF